MVISLQLDEVDALVRELYEALPESSRIQFTDRVRRTRSYLSHPTLGADIVLSLGSNRTISFAVAFGDVVLPLERAKVV